MRKAISLVAGILLLVGAIVVPIAATLVTMILPPTFSSTARIRPAVSAPAAIATEVEIILSKGVVLPVITNLNLAQKWGEKYHERGLNTDVAYLLLRRSIHVKQTGNTLLIEINVLSDSPDEAADIANELAAVYLKSPLAARGTNAAAGPQIIEQASPSLRPAYPNKLLNILTGLGVGVVMGLLGIWLILPRKSGRGGPVPAAS